MTNNLMLASFFPQLQIIGIVLTFFGIALSTLILRRKYLRRRIQGLHQFAVTDRAPFSKRSENLLQKIGLIMVLCGMLAITCDAVKHGDISSDEQHKKITNS